MARFAVRAILLEKAGTKITSFGLEFVTIHRTNAVVLKTPCTLEKVATGCAVLITVAFGQVIYKEAVKAYYNYTNRPPVITETAWTRHSLRDLSLDSPFRFDPPQDFRGKILPELGEV
jgi:hypothetical protein